MTPCGPKKSFALLTIALVAFAGCVGAPDESAAPKTPTPPSPPAPPAGGPPGNVTFREGFESPLSGWKNGSELPDDPNAPGGGKVAANVTLTEERARSGNGSARFALDGRQDDGTFWIVREIAVEPGVRYDASLSAWAWSRDESFNTIANLVMYAGTRPPSGEADFDGPDREAKPRADAAGLREPLDAAPGWKQYALDWTTPPTSGKVYVAIGITLVWESQVAYDVDDFEVKLVPVA